MVEVLKISGQTQTPPPFDPIDIDEHKDLAALGYAWIMAPVLMLSRTHSPFVRFHAKQGTVLFVLSIAVWLIPYANRALEILIFLLMVWGFLAAAQGHSTTLPIIGSLARGKLRFRGSLRQTIAAIVDTKNWAADLWKHRDASAEMERGKRNKQEATAGKVSDAQPIPPAAPVASKDVPPVDHASKL